MRIGRPSLRDYARAAEALVILVNVRVVRASRGSAGWRRILGEAVPVVPDLDVDRAPTDLEAHIAIAVARAAHRLPWSPNCLDRALAAQAMLRLRGTCATAVIGLNPDQRDGGSHWPAHAWLIGSTGTITGAGIDSGYRPVTAFRPRSARPRVRSRVPQ